MIGILIAYLIGVMVGYHSFRSKAEIKEKLRKEAFRDRQD